VVNVLSVERKSLGEIANTIDSVAAGYEYAIFDTPASGILQEAAISCADVVIVPVNCESLGMDGVAATLNAVERLAQREPRVIILPTSYDSRLNEHAQNLSYLREAYPGQVARPVIRRVAVAECHARGQTVYECDSVGARDVAMAYDEVIATITGGGK
jgi:chromosome partitioning protein